MINYEGWPTWKIIFSWEGTTLKQTWPNVLVVLLLGCAVNGVCSLPGVGYLKEDMDAQTYPLIFVSILLVFRTGYAYGRFMEGRGHVGTMVFNVRDLARMMSTFVVGEDPQTNWDRANIVRLLKAFTIANRLSCRKQETLLFTTLEVHLTTKEATRLRELGKNYPLQILQWVGKELVQFKNKQMFPRALDAMEEKVGELLGAWMGMQKLATTPFPFPYAQMCTFFLYLWCYTCPVALSMTAKWFGATIGALISFALFGINCIALELEDPFGE
jgi:putative membrane protein